MRKGGDIPYNGSYDLGTTILGFSKEVTLTIANTGEADLTITIPLIVSGTDANGFYRFVNVSKGEYVVTVDQNSLPQGAVSSTNSHSQDVPLDAGRPMLFFNSLTEASIDSTISPF